MYILLEQVPMYRYVMYRLMSNKLSDILAISIMCDWECIYTGIHVWYNCMLIWIYDYCTINAFACMIMHMKINVFIECTFCLCLFLMHFNVLIIFFSNFQNTCKIFLDFLFATIIWSCIVICSFVYTCTDVCLYLFFV